MLPAMDVERYIPLTVTQREKLKGWGWGVRQRGYTFRSCEKHRAVYDNFIRGKVTVHRTQGRFNGTSMEGKWTIPVIKYYINNTEQ